MDKSKFDGTHHAYIRKQLEREVKASGLPDHNLVMENVENAATNRTQPETSEPINVYFVVKGDYELVKKAMTCIQSIMDKGIMHKALISYDTEFFDVGCVYLLLFRVGNDAVFCSEHRV